MGTVASVCGDLEPEVPVHHPAYLGQIYAGIVLNSARSNLNSYASTLSLSSLSSFYASSLSLNSVTSRKGSMGGAGGVIMQVPILADFLRIILIINTTRCAGCPIGSPWWTR